MDVNATNFDKRTALHVAAAEGRQKIVEYLVENGAEVNMTDRWGETALQNAVRYGWVFFVFFVLFCFCFCFCCLCFDGEW